MVKPLLDVVFMSEKRKGVLLLLQDGKKEMGYLFESLDTTRQSLLPQMKVLEEHYLVEHYEDIYELTTIGKLIVGGMIPLLKTLEVLDNDVDFWGIHDLDFIPPHLLERIDELGECRIINPPTEKMYEAHNDIIEVSIQYHFSITTFFYPNFRDIFSQIISKGAEMHVILSQSLFNKLRIDNCNDIKELLSNDLVHFYVYPKKLNLLSFVYNEQMVMISPLKSNGSFDNKHIRSETPSALNWAREIFEYYLKDSTPITELQ